MEVGAEDGKSKPIAQRVSVLSGSERWVNKGRKKSKQGSSGDQEALPPVAL